MNLQVNQEIQVLSANRSEAGVYRVKKLHPQSVSLEYVAGIAVIGVAKPIPKTKLLPRIWTP